MCDPELALVDNKRSDEPCSRGGLNRQEAGSNSELDEGNATRALREAGLWMSDLSPWEFRGSRKYLWSEEELRNAIAYVDSGQGDPLD
jgi:hypothetical protein